MSSDEGALLHLLALLRVPGVGHRTSRRLIDLFGGAQAVFEASRADLESLPGLARPVRDAILKGPDLGNAQRDRDWGLQEGRVLVPYWSATYPELLQAIPDPPLLLFASGDPGLLSAPQIAIVGSRQPTSAGGRIALELAKALNQAGLVVTSGLARGIDAQAHRGALAGNGRTIAVAGTGLDRVYPSNHAELFSEILMRGAAVSEFSPGTPPAKAHFPRRNRIISGLSLGALVVEAGLKSGSLITAYQAVEQGRDVFAVPGSVRNPLSRGCHSLIKQGAKLVEAAEDVLEELRLPVASVASPVDASALEAGLAPEQQRLLALLGYDPVPVDVLVERWGLTAQKVSTMLFEMELNGLVTLGPGGLVSRN